VLDLDERHVAPARENVGAEDRLVQRNVEGLRLTFPSGLLGHRADHDSGACEIDLGSGLHGCGNGVEPVLGVDLARGAAGVFLAGVVAVPRPPLAVRTLRDVRHVIASKPRDDLGVPRRSVKARTAKRQPTTTNASSLFPRPSSGSPSTRTSWVAYPSSGGCACRLPPWWPWPLTGMSVAEILDDFPDLEADDIAEALRYAAAAVRERELPLRPSA
jgi:hypothetical protein